jgi:hypothetical protein
VFYLVSQNKGFMIGTDNGVEFGILEPQSGSSFTNASLSGTFVGGSREPQDATGSSEIDSVTADGAGNVTGTNEDNNLGGAPSQGSISATYSVASNGKVTVTQGGQVGVYLYIVSTSKFVVVPVGDTSPKLTILQK